jgi:hypothetical protein
MAKMNLNSCPRCDGAVLDYVETSEDSPMCLMCGWRERMVSESVMAEVESHLGKSFIEHTYTHSKAMRGKPPMSGWEREKKRRAQAPMRPSGQRALNAS